MQRIEQLPLLPTATTATRYTIRRDDGLWWQGWHWTADRSMAAGLHGDVVLGREIKQYLKGVEIEVIE